MNAVEDLKKRISVTRLELKNLRLLIETARRVHNKDIAQVKKMLDMPGKDPSLELRDQNKKTKNIDIFLMNPIGHLKSLFKLKNGTPRQPTICPGARATLTIEKNIFTNPEHSLEGLQSYSYVWLIFVFHKNDGSYCKTKVRPPRLNGRKMGLFATRSPHRPNPVGLTLAKIEQIHGATLFLSGIDILDGTPVLDIKPFIPIYDSPLMASNVATVEEILPPNESLFNSLCYHHLNHIVASDVDCTQDNNKQTDHVDNTTDSNSLIDNSHLTEIMPKKEIIENCTVKDAKIANWITEPLVSNLKVTFTCRARCQLQALCTNQLEGNCFFKNESEVKTAVLNILEADPRSSYRRKQCQDQLYYLTIDCFHFTCWFDEEEGIVEVVKVKLLENKIS